MMSTRIPYYLRSSLIALILVGAPAIHAQQPEENGSEASSSARPASNRYERNFIVDGNKLYRQGRFAEAETMYKKASSKTRSRLRPDSILLPPT